MEGRSLVECFSELEDPRIERSKKHSLIDIIVISLSAVIAGARGWLDIERFAKRKENWFQSFLELKNGIPSHDTIARVFSLIDVKAFETCFEAWVDSIEKRTPGEQVVFDGKALRRSFDSVFGRSALKLVSAWSAKNQVILGQTAVREGSNEITAMSDLLDALYLKGCVISMDAIGTQKEIARKIVEEKKADYILALKSNQKLLHRRVKNRFEAWRKYEFSPFEVACETFVEKAHGRIETRHYWQVDISSWKEMRAEWPGFKTIGVVEAVRETRQGRSVELRYYISSLPIDIARFSHYVRSHWSIENQLHYVLDVLWDEDQSRIRLVNARHNFALLRRLGMNLLKRETSMPKETTRGKMKIAGWDDLYLQKVLSA